MKRRDEDGDAAVVEKEGEAGPAVQGVAHGLGEIALAGDQGQLALAPLAESLDLRAAPFLAHGMADVARLAVDGSFDVVERADPLQRLAGDGAVGRLPDIVEVAPQVRPARRLAHARHAVGARLVKRLVALVGVGLQDAMEVGEVLAGVFV